MSNNFFLPQYQQENSNPCRDLYFSYSLGFLLSRLPTLDCGPDQEDYTYQLAKSLNNRIEGGKYIKMSLHVEPCSTKHVSLSMLDFRLVVGIYIKVECGRAALSLDGGDSYFPISVFMTDLGYLICGNQEQVITDESETLTELHLKSLVKDETQLTLIVVGV